MRKKLTLIVIAIVLSNISYAGLKPPRGGGFDAERLGVGAGFAFNRYFGGLGANAYAATLRISYDVSEENSVFGGFSYGFPLTQTFTSSATALSSTTSPYSVDVPVNFSVNFYELFLMYSRYFVGENEDDFSIYGSFGASLAIAATGTTYGAYDATKYSMRTSESADETYFGFTLNGALGAQFKVGPGFVYGDARIAFPANTVNGAAIENPIPASVGTNVGYKFMFGN